jgi:predicted N-formylglutamate amidohydrolase
VVSGARNGPRRDVRPLRVAPLVTCEHGGNRIPRAFSSCFQGCEALLASHRAYDPGALALARELAAHCAAPLVATTVSRLLVELNRSPGHPQLFSERTRVLPPALRRQILDDYYEPYRAQVERSVHRSVQAGRRVVHFSAHSFTPVLNGVERATDVGLLYDPKRRFERRLCERWSEVLGERIAPLRVRRNYPYRGYDDGLTRTLRSRFPDERYLGIEIEVNQKYPLQGGQGWRRLRASIVRSALQMLEEARRGLH